MLVTTPVMQAFPNATGEEQQTGLVQFPKTIALLGAALVFLVLAGAPWPRGADLGL